MRKVALPKSVDSVDHSAQGIGQQLPIQRNRSGLAHLLLNDQSRVFEGFPMMTKEGKANTQVIGYFRTAHLVAIC
jgi:hypothetical protein